MNGSVGYIPRSVDGLILRDPNLVEVVINLGEDPIKGSTPRGVITIFF